MEVKNQSYLRRLNQKAVVALLRNQELSYTDIAKKLKLSNTAISKITGDLLEKRILLREIKDTGEKGRPPIMLRINPESGLIAAIDFSTENVLICISDLSGRIIGRKNLSRTFIITKGVLFETVETIKELISSNGLLSSELLVVYIASPGRIEEKTGRFLEAYRFEDAVNLNLKTFYEEMLSCTVKIKNDVKLSIEGELQYGKLNIATQNALMLYLDAGVGSALLLGGKIYEGSSGYAGEIESYITDITNEDSSKNLAYCLSIPGMVKTLAKELEKNPFSSLNEWKSEEADFALLMKGYENNDEICLNILNQAARTIGNLIYNLVNMLDINTVILNGGIIALGQKFLEQIKTTLKKHCSSVQILYSGLKERAAIVGALHLGKIEAQEELLKRLED